MATHYSDRAAVLRRDYRARRVQNIDPPPGLDRVVSDNIDHAVQTAAFLDFQLHRNMHVDAETKKVIVARVRSGISRKAYDLLNPAPRTDPISVRIINFYLDMWAGFANMVADIRPADFTPRVRQAETFYRKARDVNNHTLSTLQRQLELAEFLDRWCPAYIMSDGNATRGLEGRLKPMWALNRELMAQPMEPQRTRDRVQVVQELGNELYDYSVGLLALWNR
ncbi:uncharacterized protein LAJ45_01062 [Morchella importuna]|uniref:Uncharacterized protein n=1 Tax=Morchella conica CCBAS932 TaxID=1392247 RepID=A0A3N4KSB9_9PEZI|nr:uncharacterized protein LAJ45_01062 [Morchella importuna]KAH8154534.1 hypothetical protein LAJ45_01062 [Morchella importuna]RPB12299.1 hypothetical protein P167DRAFT_545530 [Morchella conica CCBAS932]